MENNFFDPDIYTRPLVITKSYFRDVYPAVDPSRADLRQTGKVTIVTGAGKGIGVGIATAHAQAGVSGLVLVARTLINIEKVKEDILAQYPSVDVLAVAADVSDEEAVDRLFSQVKDRFGGCNTLVHNAGVVTTPFDVVGKVSHSVWWNDFEINTKGTYLVNEAFLRLTGQTSTTNPTVVNLVSDSSLSPPRLSSYFSSKVAVMKFTEILQAENPELAAYTIHPGLVDTDLTLDVFKPYAKDTPSLTGAVTVYLASNRPGYLRGRHLLANWNLDELESRKEEIEESNLFRLGLKI
ncbi:oxidoreductase [Xylariales sp. AK1849]|nr:oxidoreductase [Xylariales sp. AK1849]